MDISEKILKFAENQNTIDEKIHGDFSQQYQNGYNVGYSDGKTDGYNDGYDVGIVDGAASVPNPLEYAKELRYAFMNSQFPTGYELYLNLPVVTTMANAFYGAKGVKKITISGNTSKVAIAFNQVFRSCSHLEEVDFSNFCAKISNGSDMMYGSSKLREISGELDFSEMKAITKTAFTGCIELVEMRLKKNSLKLSISLSSSPKLSSATIQSIIDGLATVETTQTLTLYSTVASSLTEDQVSQILAKNWSVA